MCAAAVSFASGSACQSHSAAFLWPSPAVPSWSPDVTPKVRPATEHAVLSGLTYNLHFRRFQRLRLSPRSLLPEEYVLSIVLLHIFVGFVRTWIRSCPLNRRVVNCIRPSTLRLTLESVSRRVPRILSARVLYVSCLSSTFLLPQRTTSISSLWTI